MAIDLQNPTNIETGWRPPIQFQAPSGIGEILRNKLLQQEFQQKTIADAIKNIQSQREDAAYIKAAQEAGLLPAGDYSGLGAKTGESIADLLNKRKAEESLAAYRAALAGEAGAHGGLYQTQADYINKYGTTPGRGHPGVDFSEHNVGDIYTDADTGIRMIMTNTGPKTVSPSLQPTDVRTQNENQILKEQAGLLESKGQMDAEIEKQRQANITAEKANVPYTRSDEYNRTVNRLKQLQQSKVLPGTQPEATPQPSPAQTGNALPSSSPIPSGQGADQNLATGFGKKVSDDDVAALGWARAHPDDPRSAAILQKLGIQ